MQKSACRKEINNIPAIRRLPQLTLSLVTADQRMLQSPEFYKKYNTNTLSYNRKKQPHRLSGCLTLHFGLRGNKEVMYTNEYE